MKTWAEVVNPTCKAAGFSQQECAPRHQEKQASFQQLEFTEFSELGNVEKGAKEEMWVNSVADKHDQSGGRGVWNEQGLCQAMPTSFLDCMEALNMPSEGR